MDVLLMTATFPTPEHPSAGIFVRNQFRFFQRHATTTESFSMFKASTHKGDYHHSWWRTLRARSMFLEHHRKRYDILHVHGLSPLLFDACRYRKRNSHSQLMLTIHDRGIRQFLAQPERVRKRYRRAAASADALILSSPALEPMVRDDLGLKDYRVISAGADDLRFHPSENQSKEFDFIFVGTFNEHKGADIFLDALNMLEDKEIRVCFVGSGALREQLRRAGHHLDIQVFTDVPQPQLRQLYSSSRFLVYPARNAGFGLVVTEAMYCRLPAIVAQESGASSQVQNNVNGMTYKPNTPEQLARALSGSQSMSSEMYNTLVDGTTAANLEHSLSHVGTQLMKLYRQLSAANELKNI